MKTWKAAGIALAGLVTVLAGLITYDEARISSVRVGMTESEVVKALGRPALEYFAPLPTYVLGLACRDATMPKCLVYTRRLRTSVFIFVNREGRVVCHERAMFWGPKTWK